MVLSEGLWTYFFIFVLCFILMTDVSNSLEFVETYCTRLYWSTQLFSLYILQHERQSEKDELIQMTDRLDDEWRQLHNVVAANKRKVSYSFIVNMVSNTLR